MNESDTQDPILESLLDEAEECLHNEDPERVLELAKMARARDGENLDAWYLEAQAHMAMEQYDQAEQAFREALSRAPGEPWILLGLGEVLFEQLRLDEALTTLQELTNEASDLPEAHYLLGLTLEMLGQAKPAKESLAKARKMAPELFPKPVHMDEESFSKAVEQALSELPDKVRQAIANVAVVVEDLPDPDHLRGASPPLSPTLLGMWRGTSLPERTSFDAWTEIPGEIVLYRRNLCRMALDRDDLEEQIRTTVLHEVGHVLGLDEQDLVERGLQ